MFGLVECDDGGGDFQAGSKEAGFSSDQRIEAGVAAVNVVCGHGLGKRQGSKRNRQDAQERQGGQDQ